MYFIDEMNHFLNNKILYYIQKKDTSLDDIPILASWLDIISHNMHMMVGFSILYYLLEMPIYSCMEYVF